MNTTLTRLALASLTVLGTLGSAGTATAQVAGGTTTVETQVTETTRLAMGWSVKKTLLGKTVYNETGQKVGKVEDLIISTDRSVSYVIVGAGGFVGIGRHDVAIPVSQIQDRSGRLVMAGANRETIKGLPAFSYASDTTRRDQFVASAGKDITRGRAALATLEKNAATATADGKARIDLQISALRLDLTSAESRLAAMTEATAVRWHEFEADVNAATARLRQTIGKATG